MDIKTNANNFLMAVPLFLIQNNHTLHKYVLRRISLGIRVAQFQLHRKHSDMCDQAVLGLYNYVCMNVRVLYCKSKINTHLSRIVSFQAYILLYKTSRLRKYSQTLQQLYCFVN